MAKRTFKLKNTSRDDYQYYVDRDADIALIMDYLEVDDGFWDSNCRMSNTKSLSNVHLYGVHALSLGMIDRDWFDEHFPDMRFDEAVEHVLVDLETVWDIAGEYALDGEGTFSPQAYYEAAYSYAPFMIRKYVSTAALSILDWDMSE